MLIFLVGAIMLPVCFYSINQLFAIWAKVFLVEGCAIIVKLYLTLFLK